MSYVFTCVGPNSMGVQMYKGQRLTLSFLLGCFLSLAQIRNFASVASLTDPGISHLSLLHAGNLQAVVFIWILEILLVLTHI